jgi:hypothetical protein
MRKEGKEEKEREGGGVPPHSVGELCRRNRVVEFKW